MIKGEMITKTFDGFAALQNTNITVPKGCVYGLVGPNGAGKTTLIRHLVGVMKPEKGSITLEGEKIYENAAVKARIGYISDDAFYFRTSTLDSLKNFYRDLYASFDEEYFESMLSCFPEIRLKKQIRRMSKGMQKQVAFLLTLSTKPEVLILDEPMDGLDPVMRRQVWNLVLDAVTERAMTVLVSSHNLRELEDVCDYVGLMHHGEIILEQSLTTLQDDIHKVQLAFEQEETAYEMEKSEALDILHHAHLGKVHTYIIRGEAQQMQDSLDAYEPMFMDLLPLTLEEIFIYELGGEHYEIQDIFI